MKRILPFLATSLALAFLMLSCKGGNSNDMGPSDINPSDTNTSPFSNTGLPGEPTELDWAHLGAQFESIGVSALQRSLSAAASDVLGRVPGSARQDLGVPSSDVSVSAAFLCCGTMATSNLTVTGEIRGSTGTLSVMLTYDSDTALRWSSSNGGTTWDLEFQGGLLLTSNLVTAGGSVAPVQEIRLGGTVLYLRPSGEQKSAPISLVLADQDFEHGSPTAMGNIGPLEVPSVPLPQVNEPERCSRPQEGCGPGVSGQCPCTIWPPCPVYGITCSGS